MRYYKTDIATLKDAKVLILTISNTCYCYKLESEHSEYNKNRINHFLEWLYEIEVKHDLYIFNNDTSYIMDYIDNKYFNEYLNN